MKFCSHCGKELKDEAVICTACGCSVENKSVANKDYNKSKTGIGVLCALFLGIIGLIIGLVMYPSETEARKTFLKGWGITFGVSVGVAVLIYVIVIVVGLSSVSVYY